MNNLCRTFFTLIVSFTVQAQTSDADVILQKHIEARGGQEQIKSVETVRMIGSNQLYELDWTLMPLEISLARPGHIRIDNYWFEGDIVQLIHDGRAVWKDPNIRDYVEMIPFQKDVVSEMADLDGVFIDSVKKGYRVRYAGKETLEGNEVYRFEIMRSGFERDVFIDAASYFIIKEIQWRLVKGVVLKIEKVYRDYRAVAGVMFPFEIETIIDGHTNNHYKFIDIQVNPDFFDSLFMRNY